MRADELQVGLFVYVSGSKAGRVVKVLPKSPHRAAKAEIQFALGQPYAITLQSIKRLATEEEIADFHERIKDDVRRETERDRAEGLSDADLLREYRAALTVYAAKAWTLRAAQEAQRGAQRTLSPLEREVASRGLRNTGEDRGYADESPVHIGRHFEGMPMPPAQRPKVQL